jgi:hypothetical protein
LEAQPAQDESEVSLSTCSRDIPQHLLSDENAVAIRQSSGSSSRGVPPRNWRRGSESNTPRSAKQTDSGFEDREGHQAPITLRDSEKREKARTREKTLSLAQIADFFKNRIRLGKLAGGSFRINLLSIYSHFEDTPAGRDQSQRSNLLLQLEQFVRQTDGMRFIISSRAILNRNFQGHVSI